MGGHLEMRQRQVEWPPELGATVTAPEELSLPTLQYLCKPVWLVIDIQLSTSALECKLCDVSLFHREVHLYHFFLDSVYRGCHSDISYSLTYFTRHDTL